ncbi:MAG: winged helix-turn-helix domain-containing protein [Candidatus Sigynarchaeota archaeon]
MPDNEWNEPPPSPRDDATRTRIEHDIYLKAVNHPTRRRLLELVAKAPLAPETAALKLVEEGLLQNDGQLKYHLDMLVKARCIEIERDPQGNIKTLKITQAGQVVDYMEK